VASRLHRESRPVSGVLAREDVAHAFGAAWKDLTGGGIEQRRRERIHELRDVNAVPRPAGRFTPAGDDDAELAVRWGHEFFIEATGASAAEPDNSEAAMRSSVTSGTLFFWRDASGRPVSMAVRVRPSAKGESISWVYTPPEERRRGYATAVVAELASLILAEGREFCALYTDLANPTSNKIYREIGFVPRADVVELDFVPA
jgi:hypothetical protein